MLREPKNSMANKKKAILFEPDKTRRDAVASALYHDLNITECDNLEEALQTAVSDSSFHYFICRAQSVSEENLLFLIKKIHTVNPQISKIITEVSERWENENNDLCEKYSLTLVSDEAGEESLLFAINHVGLRDSKQRRQFNRIEWPLTVQIKPASGKGEPILKNILSVSGNGVFVKSEDYAPIKEQTLILQIYFKDFKLLTEAKVVWVNDGKTRSDLPLGFAASFKNVTPSSQKVIDAIIKDKMLKNLLFEYNHIIGKL